MGRKLFLKHELLLLFFFTGSYGSFIFNFLRNLYTILHNSFINLLLTNSIQRFPFLHISPTFIIFFLMIGIFPLHTQLFLLVGG